MKKRLAVLTVLLILVGGYYGYTSIPSSIIATGTVESQVSRLGTKTGGRVLHIYFSEGDKVKQGDIIVALDDRVEQAKLAIAQTKLQETGNFKITQNELELARLSLEETKITAPFEGVIDLIAVEQGDVVSPNLPIIQLRNEQIFEIIAYVSQDHLAKINLGDTLHYTTDVDETPMAARVTHISSKSEFVPKQISTKSDREYIVYKIKLQPQTPTTTLKSGMYVQLHY